MSHSDSEVFKLDEEQLCDAKIFNYATAYNYDSEKKIETMKREINNLKREVGELKAKIRYLELQNKKKF